MTKSAETRQTPSSTQPRSGNRRKVQVPARLTWRDAGGTLRFASVLLRDVSDVDAFVECQVAAAIPLYRLVHVQLERPNHGVEVPLALRQGKVLSAIYRVGPYATASGTPSGYGLRMLVDPLCAAPRATVEDTLAIAN